MAAEPNWHEGAFFGLHYDLHPNAGDTELGRETTYEHIREQLDKVKPDFVQYDCKGHPGYTGYPTKVGSPSPGIINDALKVWRQVTRDMGIPLSIHYSGVWDTRAIELHPDWANVNASGKPNPNNTCPLSDYTEKFMVPQLLEVVRDYQIDGMWIDGENWASAPCWCGRCKAEFTRRTGIAEAPERKDQPNWDQWLAFQRDLFVEHVTKYTNAVHAENPKVTVCSNWMYSVRMPEPVAAPVDCLSGDFDPSFGGLRAMAEARFIASRGLPWDLMAWTFLNTGNQGWTMKTAVHLCQEVSEVLSQGGAVFLYNQPQRSGRLTAWHQDLFAQVADFCRKRKDFCFRSETVPQVALLHSETFYYTDNAPLFNFGDRNELMEGALHALVDSGYSVDILDEEALLERMADYPMVVVPEQAGLPEKLVAGLRAYVQQGGQLLVSGAHVAAEYPDLCGATQAEGQAHGYVPADNGCVQASGPWQKVTLTTAVETAPLLNQQDPALNLAGQPAVTVNTVGNGRVVAIYGPVFRVYYQSHYPLLRRFIGDALGQLDASKLIRFNGPWWVEMATRQKDGRMLIQFVNRGAGGYLAPNRHTVETVPDAGPFTVTIPMEKRPARCYLAPDEAGIDWTWHNGVVTVQVGGLQIHNVLVIEPPAE
ncbi:MAG: hypothetical protein QG656_2658 [Candidatus Hydrogenedentes bacterium]|nr:hypothetical protein [Candidatus Hydrogenedentota bacterium]